MKAFSNFSINSMNHSAEMNLAESNNNKCL